MSQSPMPYTDRPWPILAPGAGWISLLAHPDGPVIATARVSATGWRISGNGINAHSSTRSGALAILAAAAGPLECWACDTPIVWRFRPGRHGTWEHTEPPPEGPHIPQPIDDSWQTL